MADNIKVHRRYESHWLRKLFTVGFLGSCEFHEYGTRVSCADEDYPLLQYEAVWYYYLLIIFSGSAAQRRLWPPVALQPSAGYGLLVHEVS
jgi:hypothetical protein